MLVLYALRNLKKIFIRDKSEVLEEVFFLETVKNICE